MISIYGLIDPRSGEVRYVGKSIRPKERLANHCNDRSSTWRTHWLRELQSEGLKPTLVIFEELPDGSDWQSAERRWIADARAKGWPLTNCTSGGDGVCDLPPDVRSRMAAVWLGRRHRPESLVRIGAASRGRTHTPEYRAYMRRIMTGRKIQWVDKVARSLSHLTDEQVRDIRALIAQGVPHRTIGPMFGIHPTSVSNIRRRKSYSWVEATA